MFQRIIATGGRAMSVLGDVTHYREIERIRSEIEAQLGPVDILVANAGGNLSPPGAVEEIDEAQWRVTVDANLTSTFLTIKSFLPGMKARGGDHPIRRLGTPEDVAEAALYLVSSEASWVTSIVLDVAGGGVMR